MGQAVMKKRVLTYLLAGILLIVGLVMIFNQPITNFLVNRITQTSLQQPIQQKTKKQGEFNFKKVKSADTSAIVKASVTKQTVGSIGKIAIPAVNLKLPIFYGISNSNLLRGAGTLKAKQKMGSGNYALAGHHMNNPNILFSPLAKAKVGEMVYLTDGQKVYRYRLTTRKTISKYQVNVIDDQPNKKMVTLITCDPIPGVAKTPLRILLQGTLQAVENLNAENKEIFK